MENWQLDIWQFGQTEQRHDFSEWQPSFVESNTQCPKQPLLNQLYVFRYFDNPENTFTVSYNT